MKTESYKQTRKKRYLVYRALGYNSKTSTALSQRELDVSELEISKKTGKLKRNKKTKHFLENLDYYQEKTYVNNYNSRVSDYKALYTDDYLNAEKLPYNKSGTVLTFHGMLTHDKRFKGENGKIIQIIKNQNKLTTNQAYYFFYHMTQSGMTYQETREQLLSNKDFEMYEKRKQAGLKTYINPEKSLSKQSIKRKKRKSKRKSRK
jgi:hypothetical protein